MHLKIPISYFLQEYPKFYFFQLTLEFWGGNFLSFLSGLLCCFLNFDLLLCVYIYYRHTKDWILEG